VYNRYRLACVLTHTAGFFIWRGMIATWRNDTGGVSVGILVEARTVLAVPLIEFPTWREYTDWVMKQCMLIELEYECTAVGESVKNAVNVFVNSLEAIDNVKE